MKKQVSIAHKLSSLIALAMAVVFACFGCGKPNVGEGGGVIGGEIDDDPYVTELVITNPPVKTAYKPGERFSTDGMTLVAKWSHKDDDGNFIEEDITPQECESVTPTGPLPAGTTGITFTYEGKSVVQPITMDAAELTGVVFDHSAISKTQIPGTIDLSVIKATAQYDDGSTMLLESFTIEVDGSAVENPSAFELTAGKHTMVLSYDKYKSAEIAISVINGYSVEPSSIIYSDYLAANREALSGKNFIENPVEGIYFDKEGKVIARSEDGGTDIYDINGEFKYSKYPKTHYRVITEPKGDIMVSYIGDIKKGFIMRYHIYSELETRVELVLNAASGLIMAGSGWDPTRIDDMQFNKTFEVNRIEVDPQTNLPATDDDGNEIKNKIEIDDNVILPGSSSENPNPELWTNLVDISFGEQTLQEGYNIFELKVISDYKNYMGVQSAANMGAFKVLVLPEECEEHTLVKADGTPSTCIVRGEAEYWRCSECTRTYADANAEQRIYNAPVKLPFGDHTPSADATCKQSQTCTTCNIVLVDKSTVAHTPGAAATCEHEQTCTVCDTVLQQKTAHTMTGVACGQSGECSVCHQTVQKEHADIVWEGDEAKCGVCGSTAGKRYVVQAEDESKITLTGTRTIEETTATQNWADPVSKSAMGGALSGLETNTNNKTKWSKGDTITVALNVDGAGAYRLGMRCQANQSNGNGNPQDLSGMFKYKVNDGEYAAIVGKAASATQVGNWHKTFNWGVVYFGEAELAAGANILTLEFQGGRGCNIDYFVAESVVDAQAPAAEIIYVNGQTNTFAKGATTKHGVLENVVIRLAVPAAKQGEAGFAYRDYTITDEMLGGAFDTSTAGKKQITITLPEYAKAFTDLTTVTFEYTVTEAGGEA